MKLIPAGLPLFPSAGSAGSASGHGSRALVRSAVYTGPPLMPSVAIPPGEVAVFIEEVTTYMIENSGKSVLNDCFPE
jgi:hypothetical protein